MFTIGNKELEEAQVVGDFILCNNCGKRHKVKTTFSDNGTMSLQSYKCGDKSYLVGINKKDIRKAQQDTLEQKREDKVESFEIYFDDLNEGAKKNYLEFVRVTDESELNHEIAPLAIIDIEIDDA